MYKIVFYVFELSCQYRSYVVRVLKAFEMGKQTVTAWEKFTSENVINTSYCVILLSNNDYK